MQHFFQRGSSWHPFRWFIVAAASCTMLMSFADYSGYRLLSFGSGGRVGPGGSGSVYGRSSGGSHYYHK